MTEGNAMTTKTILPCPFCGEQPIGPTQSDGSDERNGYNFAMSIVCKCGASISRSSSSDKNGWCNDEGEAEAAVIKAWNSRNGGNQ